MKENQVDNTSTFFLRSDEGGFKRLRCLIICFHPEIHLVPWEHFPFPVFVLKLSRREIVGGRKGLFSHYSDPVNRVNQSRY